MNQVFQLFFEGQTNNFLSIVSLVQEGDSLLKNKYSWFVYGASTLTRH